VNLQQLEAVRGGLEITIRNGDERLVESVSPLVICDLAQEGRTHEEPQPAE
jgi:hypothetical protein